MSLIETGKKARNAARILANSNTQIKNTALTFIAEDLKSDSAFILKANRIDIENAIKNGMSSAMTERLTLTKERIDSIAEGVLKVRDLPDPIGEIMSETDRPNGIHIVKKRVPLGVIGVIYESRPNVTADTASLCLKSSNACILRGGKEAINSNSAIADIMDSAVKRAGLPDGTIQLIRDTSRESATELMHLNEYVDILIPRGGAGLINAVIQNATIPVIQTGVGNCHIFVDKDADIDMAIKILINAKVSRPSVCNAAETLLIHKDISEDFYIKASKALADNGVKVRACERCIGRFSDSLLACEDDFKTEFNDYILAVKMVDSVDEAISHIDKYGTGHSECIVTESDDAAEEFLSRVDAAAVYRNVSTRFTDGFEFGFGAEIGISTQKMHARGPMGLTELTSYKYVITGKGQTR